MKLVISIILAIGVALALAMYAQQDPGFVVLSRQWAGEHYTVKLPLALFVLFLIIAFVILYLLFNFIAGLFRAPKRIGAWRKGKKELSAQQHTMKGFAGLIEGNWSDAEGNLLSKLDHNNASLMNYLGAAYAAQQQGQLARRNQHLDEALEKHPRQELAIKLTRARMQMQAGEWGDARNQLEYLRLSTPKNVAVARLLADTYREVGDWPSLVKLMPALTKLKAFPVEELQAREKHALSQHLESPALLQGDGSMVEQTFKALPRRKRKDANAVASFARQLIRAGEGQRAETVLRKALNKEWNGELVRLYGVTETNHVRDQIALLESWGKKHVDDTDLMFAMARLCRRDNQLEKARELLGKVVSVTANPEAITELGELLEQMGEHESALLTYKLGMKAVAGESTLAASVASVETNLVALSDLGDDAEPTDTLPVVSDTNQS